MVGAGKWEGHDGTGHGTDQDLDALDLGLCGETKRVGEFDERGEPSDERPVQGEGGRFRGGSPCSYAPSAPGMTGDDH